MHYEWSETQRSEATRIAVLPPEEQARELLKWALGRITFYGPTDEPCAACIREYLDGGIEPRNDPAAIGQYAYPVSEKEHGLKDFYAKRPLPKDVPNPDNWPLVQVMVRLPGGKYGWVNIDERQILPF